MQNLYTWNFSFWYKGRLKKGCVLPLVL